MKSRTVFQKPTTKVFHMPGAAKMEFGDDGVLFEKDSVRIHLDGSNIRLEADKYLFVVASNGLELGNNNFVVESIKMIANDFISFQTFDKQEPIAIQGDRVGIKSKEVRFEKKEIPLVDMLNATELQELYSDLLVREHYKSLSKVYAMGTRPSQGGEAPKITPSEAIRQRVEKDPDAKQKARERMGQLEESELRSLYQTKYVKESQDKKTTKKMKEEKEGYTRNYNLQSSLMTKASQGKTQSEQPLEVNAKSIESKSISSILNLDPVMAQLQSLFEKSGLDLLAISQKPEYLGKTEDTSKLYSRFTFYQKVVAPQILGAELNILLGVVAIVSAVFTGGGSLLLYTLVAGELILGGAEIKINAEKLGDLYDGEYYTNPKFLGMDQDVVNALGLVLGGAEISLGLKALLKSGDLAANARYIDDLEDILDNVRLVPEGSRNIPKSVEPSVLKQVDLTPDHVDGKYYYEGYFDPNIDIAHGWEKALAGELSPEEKVWFRQLTDHELDESIRMQNGEVYRTIESWDPVKGMTGDPPGAHDNAPKPPGDYPDPKFKPKY
ncbi:hypothetical protein [Paenibacillus sp. IHBB 10380]|uniref:hypothetical protein n=1 Tax=Paenibacillus sp. IHBB 10380 TaxID=1566358 RepID=UPI000AD4B979|nr:hypothetical protein [Paenibacillus sp. IHBB 10380]